MSSPQVKEALFVYYRNTACHACILSLCNTIRITYTGSLQRVIKVHGGPVFTLRWSKRGDLVITGSADTGTKVLDANTWTVKQTFTPHEGECVGAGHAWGGSEGGRGQTGGRQGLRLCGACMHV